MTELVLIVDDEPGILATLGGILTDEGYATVSTTSGAEALALYEERQPALVFLDIWLADRDGLETLQALRESDPAAAVVMMSGHGTAATAVRAIKMGAFDYLEKPLSYRRAVEAAAGALAYRRSLVAGGELAATASLPRGRIDAERLFSPPPPLPLLAPSGRPQRTLRPRHRRLRPRPPFRPAHRHGRSSRCRRPRGIHFVSLPTGLEIPAHVRSVADTDYATTLAGDGESIKTVEHLLSALHAYGVTNLLIKVHGEIPVLDGSALEFCRMLEEVGVEDQDGAAAARWSIDRRYEVANGGEKLLTIEPCERLRGLLPAALPAAGGRADLRVHARRPRQATSARSPRRGPSAS